MLSRGHAVLELDHYLEILLGKPGALPGSTALAQAREAGRFTATHEAFWAAARNRHGDAAGTRALIEVLLLHRRLRRDAVLAGIRAALAAGSVSADVVAIEARKHITTADITTADITTANITTADITTADITTADITTADAVTGAQAGEPAAPQRSRAAVVTLGARRRAALACR